MFKFFKCKLLELDASSHQVSTEKYQVSLLFFDSIFFYLFLKILLQVSVLNSCPDWLGLIKPSKFYIFYVFIFFSIKDKIS